MPLTCAPHRCTGFDLAVLQLLFLVSLLIFATGTLLCLKCGRWDINLGVVEQIQIDCKLTTFIGVSFKCIYATKSQNDVMVMFNAPYPAFPIEVQTKYSYIYSYSTLNIYTYTHHLNRVTHRLTFLPPLGTWFCLEIWI